MRATARRGFVVVLRNEPIDFFGQFVAELRPLPGRAESDHRLSIGWFEGFLSSIPDFQLLQIHKPDHQAP